MPFLSSIASTPRLCYCVCGMCASLDQLSSKGLDRLMLRNLEDVSPAEKVRQGAAAESGQKANPGLDRVNTFSSKSPCTFRLYHCKQEFHSRQTLASWIGRLFQTVLGMLGQSGMIGAFSNSAASKASIPVPFPCSHAMWEKPPIAYLAYKQLRSAAETACR